MRRVKPGGRTPAGSLFGEAPYGWRISRDRSRLVVDRGEQRVLVLVRALHGVDRIPMREIAKRLHQLGVLNRRGTPFGLSRIWEMVHGRKTPPPETAAPRSAGRSRATRGA